MGRVHRLRRFMRVMAAAVSLLGAGGVAGAQPQATSPAQPLVVPWTDVEPYAYMGRDGVEGLFADLARELGRRLDRPIEFRHFATTKEHAAAQTRGETDMLPGVAALPFLRERNK